jgi:hypothetical protein
MMKIYDLVAFAQPGVLHLPSLERICLAWSASAHPGAHLPSLERICPAWSAFCLAWSAFAQPGALSLSDYCLPTTQETHN